MELMFGFNYSESSYCSKAFQSESNDASLNNQMIDFNIMQIAWESKNPTKWLFQNMLSKLKVKIIILVNDILQLLQLAT